MAKGTTARTRMHQKLSSLRLTEDEKFELRALLIEDPDLAPKETTPLTSVAAHLTTYQQHLGDGSRQLEGLTTGMASIDKLIGGLNRFVLLAGTGGTGKSTLAVQLGIGVVHHEQIPVIYFSFEMNRDDVMTLMLQNLSQGNAVKLHRKTLVLNGNNPALGQTYKDSIAQATGYLKEIADLFYIADATDPGTSLDQIQNTIEQVMEEHQATQCLIILDSIQDLVQNGTNNQAGQEAVVAQKLVEIQQATGATILAISQKSKAGIAAGGYTSVLGSVAMIHKPTTVIEMTGVREILAAGKVKNDDTRLAYNKLSQNSDVAQPVFINVIKGRNNGYGITALSYHGQFRYFDEQQVRDYDNGDFSLYSLMGLPHEPSRPAPLPLPADHPYTD